MRRLTALAVVVAMSIAPRMRLRRPSREPRLPRLRPLRFRRWRSRVRGRLARRHRARRPPPRMALPRDTTAVVAIFSSSWVRGRKPRTRTARTLRVAGERVGASIGRRDCFVGASRLPSVWSPMGSSLPEGALESRRPRWGRLGRAAPAARWVDRSPHETPPTGRWRPARSSRTPSWALPPGAPHGLGRARGAGHGAEGDAPGRVSQLSPQLGRENGGRVRARHPGAREGGGRARARRVAGGTCRSDEPCRVAWPSRPSPNRSGSVGCARFCSIPTARRRPDPSKAGRCSRRPSVWWTAHSPR